MTRHDLWDRRRFLRAAAMAPAVLAMLDRLQAEAGGRVRIDRVDVYPARYPMTGYFKFFTGPHGSRGRAAVFVKITASDGTAGWGQSVPIARWRYETLETDEQGGHAQQNTGRAQDVPGKCDPGARLESRATDAGNPSLDGTELLEADCAMGVRANRHVS